MKPNATKKVSMSAGRRLALIEEVYRVLLEVTETFEEPKDVGVTLVYLFGAIAKDDYIEATTENSTEVPFIALMIEHFPNEHRVWDFIELRGPMPGDREN